MENETITDAVADTMGKMSPRRRYAFIGVGVVTWGCIGYTVFSLSKKLIEVVTTEVIEEIV